MLSPSSFLCSFPILPSGFEAVGRGTEIHAEVGGCSELWGCHMSCPSPSWHCHHLCLHPQSLPPGGLCLLIFLWIPTWWLWQHSSSFFRAHLWPQSFFCVCSPILSPFTSRTEAPSSSFCCCFQLQTSDALSAPAFVRCPRLLLLCEVRYPPNKPSNPFSLLLSFIRLKTRFLPFFVPCLKALSTPSARWKSTVEPHCFFLAVCCRHSTWA